MLPLLALLVAACAHAPAAPAAPAAPGEDSATERVLLAAEDALFDAIHHRDAAALGALVVDSGFVMRMPGDPDVLRDEFVGLPAQIPGEILDVSGEQVTARRFSADLGAVTGVQVVRLRVDGTESTHRVAFTDVFRREPDGRWRVLYVHAVSLPPPATP
jgi:ketosteroid isomerase-like protein